MLEDSPAEHPLHRGSGPQHSVRRLPFSGQVQCTSWRIFAPFSSSTFKNIHGEQAGKRDRGGSAVGVRHIVREHATTQTVLNTDIKRAARSLPLESSARRCSGSKFSARRGLPSKSEARAPHHQPCPSSDLDHALPDALSTGIALSKAMLEKPPHKPLHELRLLLHTHEKWRLSIHPSVLALWNLRGEAAPFSASCLRIPAQLGGK